jgi:HEAT repeat protein
MTTLLQSLDREGEMRSNAIEILENVLRGEIRTETIATINPLPDSDSKDAERIVTEILQEGCSSWVRIGALYAAGRIGDTESDQLTEDLRHAHPVVRETALNALSDLAPDRAILEARKLIEDESEIVRNLAEVILQAEAA